MLIRLKLSPVFGDGVGFSSATGGTIFVGVGVIVVLSGFVITASILIISPNISYDTFTLSSLSVTSTLSFSGTDTSILHLAIVCVPSAIVRYIT